MTDFKYKYKFLLFLTIVSIDNTVSQLSNEAPPTYEENQRVFYFADANGKLRLVDLDEEEVEPRGLENQRVEFEVYTRNNPDAPEVVRKDNNESFTISKYYSHSNPTKVVIHGWFGDGDSDINSLIKNAFLKVADVNVICVDWGSYSKTLYTLAVINVPTVGKIVGKYINWLIEGGSDSKAFHLLGHSLGAHVAAVASRNVKKGKIETLTGMDPANPLWPSNPNRLKHTDAEYVEVIHTNAGNLGLRNPIGHNDFYPNGGKRQPGCSFFEIGCSHSRSFELVASSVLHDKFLANKCKDFDDLVSDRICTNRSTIKMGGLKTKPKSGIFYVKTTGKKPFYIE